MPRTRIHNFHDAKLSVAQSAIRENVARLAPGAPESGPFAHHPVMQAAGHVLDRVYRGEVRDARTAIRAYELWRARQTAEGMLVATPPEVTAACLDLLAQFVIAWVFDDRDAMREIRNEWKFSPCDVSGALKMLEDWLGYYWRGAEPHYNPPTADAPGPFPLPPPASPGAPLRVGLLGDWGTGSLEAGVVVDQLMRRAPDLIIHVGDVYYSGTEAEQSAVLRMVRAARAAHGRNVPVYTLPGNHDYYAGGAAFYQLLPRLNEGVPNASAQEHSFWCLRNDAWQLQGMDTGYYDHDLLTKEEDITRLRDDEALWHRRQLVDACGRRVILFSHHQLFSAFEHIGAGWENPYLMQNLRDWEAAANLRPAAWFWGHEHVLGVYQVPGSLPVLGRLVGNGAIPVFIDTDQYTPKPEGAPLQPAESSPDGRIAFPNGYVQSQHEDVAWCSGFAMLELASDGTARAEYWQVTFEGDVRDASSQLLWEEGISV